MEKKYSNMSCGERCLKLLLGLLNILFFISGVALAAVAGYTAFNKNSSIQKVLTALNLPELNYGLYVLFAVGIFMAILSFVGLWGTIAENTCLLYFYFLAVFIIFVAQLAGLILCIVEFNKIEGALVLQLSKKPPSNDTGALLLDTVFQAALDAFEKKFHCCGITGPENYGSNPLPSTCRPEVIIGPSTATLVPTAPPYPGCVKVAQPYVFAIVGVAIALLVLELLVIVFTCCLVSAINNQYIPL